MRAAEKEYREKEERQEIMASVNKVILVGNLGKDPELRYTQSGVAVCSFSLATTEKWSDQSGHAKEQTEWHRVQVWKRMAEVCSKYLKKGSSAYVEGRIQSRSWEDASGQKRTTTEIVAETVRFLGSSKNHGAHEHQPIQNEAVADWERVMDPDIPF